MANWELKGMKLIKDDKQYIHLSIKEAHELNCIFNFDGELAAESQSEKLWAEKPHYEVK